MAYSAGKPCDKAPSEALVSSRLAKQWAPCAIRALLDYDSSPLILNSNHMVNEWFILTILFQQISFALKATTFRTGKSSSKILLWSNPFILSFPCIAKVRVYSMKGGQRNSRQIVWPARQYAKLLGDLSFNHSGFMASEKYLEYDQDVSAWTEKAMVHYTDATYKENIKYLRLLVAVKGFTQQYTRVTKGGK